MLKKFLKLSALALVLSTLFATSVFAVPANQDATEPGNNAESTTYFFSQNVLQSWIQYSSDLDFWKFVAPKTVSNQEIWILPPSGKNYAVGIYDVGSGSPLAFKQSNGNLVSIYANLVAGRTYTILVLPADGTYDINNTYYLGFPNLFPY